MRYLNISVLVFSLSSMCFGMDSALESKLTNCERFPQTLVQEMREITKRYSARQSTYNEFTNAGRIRAGHYDIAPSDYESRVKAVVDEHGLIVGLNELSSALDRQKTIELGKVKEMWFEGRREKARSEIEEVFKESKNCLSRMIETVRCELNPQIRERLKSYVQSNLEVMYKEWEKTESGKQITNKFSPQYKTFLQEKFWTIRGIPETDPAYTALSTIIENLQLLPIACKNIPGNSENSIKTSLQQHTDYPEDMLNDHVGEVFTQLASSTKAFIHVVGLKNDFYREFFNRFGITPVSKSMNEVLRCTTPDQVRAMLFGAESNKGWLLETLQQRQPDCHTYLNSVLLIEDGESFFGNTNSIPRDAASSFIESLKIIIDVEKSSVESPFFKNSGINISKLKIIMTGDGNFLEDFLLDKPDYLEQELFDAFDDRLSDKSTYVIANTHRLDRISLRKILDTELKKHEDYNSLDEYSKKVIFRRIQKMLQGGSTRELGQTTFAQKNYVIAYSKSEIKPYITQLVNEYIEKRIASFKE